jgi:hypothetical protein
MLIAIPSIAVAQTYAPSSVGLFHCLKEQTRNLDDGVSDARTIAAAVNRMCLDERITDTVLRLKESRDMASRIVQINREHDIDTTTALVLQERGKRRDSKK